MVIIGIKIYSFDFKSLPSIYGYQYINYFGV